jgi:hypothetical protein
VWLDTADPDGSRPSRPGRRVTPSDTITVGARTLMVLRRTDPARTDR